MLNIARRRLFQGSFQPDVASRRLAASSRRLIVASRNGKRDLSQVLWSRADVGGMNSITLHTRNQVPKTLLRRMNTTFHAMAENPAEWPEYEEMTAAARAEADALQEVLDEINMQETRLDSLRAARDKIFPRAQQAYATLSCKVAERARGNKAVIASAAFQTTRERRNLGLQPLPQPHSVQITASSDAGKAEVWWPCVAEKTCCVVEINDGPGPDGWRQYTITFESRCSLENLPSGQRVWVRLRAIGSKKRVSPWSNPVSVMVA